jgi:hypothetical protein
LGESPNSSAYLRRLRSLNRNKAPVPQQPATQPTAQPASARITVWVNTATGYYHRPDSRHYGKTKRGKYKTEADAIRAGFRPAQN